jgi:hypothetical protein
MRSDEKGKSAGLLSIRDVLLILLLSASLTAVAAFLAVVSR